MANRAEVFLMPGMVQTPFCLATDAWRPTTSRGR
jgi:hypothetical protein